MFRNFLFSKQNVRTFSSATHAKPSIAVIGATQTGLQLGIRLQQKGFPVSLFTDRNSQQTKISKIYSNPLMFANNLPVTRQFGLHHEEHKVETNNSISVTVTPPTPSVTPLFNLQSVIDQPFQAIDPRLNLSLWMGEFVNQGGNLLQKKALNANEVNNITQQHALTIVTDNESQIYPANYTTRYLSLNPFQRALAYFYVKGVQPTRESSRLRINIIPTIGNFFTLPGSTLKGNCQILLFDGIVGNHFDCWEENNNLDQLERAKALLNQFLPWESKHFLRAYLCDEKSAVLFKYPSTIKPQAFISTFGKPVLKFADIMHHNPIINATLTAKMIDTCMTSILKQSKLGNAFNKKWLDDVLDNYAQNTSTTEANHPLITHTLTQDIIDNSDNSRPFSSTRPMNIPRIYPV